MGIEIYMMGALVGFILGDMVLKHRRQKQKEVLDRMTSEMLNFKKIALSLNIPGMVKSVEVPKSLNSFGINPRRLLDLCQYNLSTGPIAPDVLDYVKASHSVGNTRGLDVVEILQGAIVDSAVPRSIYVALVSETPSPRQFCFVAETVPSKQSVI